MFLCFNRVKENDGSTINKAGSLHAVIVLRACSCFLLRDRAVCVHSPYSTKSHGGSHLIHVVEDMSNFSSPDNYWVFDLERTVKRFVNQTTNHRNIET